MAIKSNSFITTTPHDMTVSQNFDLSLGDNFGFYLQWMWTGLTGSAKVKFQGSTDGTNWADLPISDGGTVVYELTISGAADTDAFEKPFFYGDKLRIVYTADTASAGTIDFRITQIANRDTY